MNGYRTLQTLYISERVTVSRALRDSDGKSVILKSQNAEYPTLQDLTRIQYEFELSRKYPVSGMVPILSLEKQGNAYTLVLEDVGGIPLLEYWNQSPKTIPLFLDLAIGITENLSHLHKTQIIHKDIKPANILVQKETGNVYLIDLGLASLLRSEEQAPIQPESLEGTLSYISPEQTGRMNRSIDFRSDLYSLGITFYELLAGRLPFLGSDPVELVHAHIASSPESPLEINNSIPPRIAELILKLLSKNAEDRYQSADGLGEDLILAKELILNHKPLDFIPGERESQGIFSIPQRLYGREAEVGYLLEAFDKIATPSYRVNREKNSERYGGVKLVLVGGYSGVGKTALINEVHKPILEKRGYFLSGKFDQFKRNIPYSGLVQAFTGLVRQILTEREEKILQKKARILEACGPDLVLMTDLIPELIHITGAQKPIGELPPHEAEERFLRTFLHFVSVFSAADHPLTLFIDDLQWADTPTLKFLELLTKSKDLHHLFILGAYRDNEVDEIHPLTLLIQNLEKENIHILKIFLTPLLEFFIEKMICDTLHKQVGSELPKLIYKKTGGNPFFVRQLLKTLYQDGYISYIQGSGWSYNIQSIESANYTENVVEFVARRLHSMSGETREILKIASCMGDRFSLHNLSNVLHKNMQETALSLRESLQEGVIYPLNQAYKSAEIPDSNSLVREESLKKIEYKFIHDRVQQASNSLLTPDERNLYHVKIGKIFLNTATEETLHEQIFEVVNHLNYGLANISDEDRETLIQLNYRAGLRAVESFAYEVAITYFESGISILKESSGELVFQLKFELLNAMFKAGKVRESRERVDEVFSICTTKFEKAKVYSLKVECQANLGEYEDSVKSCIEALRLFDIDLKSSATPRDIFTYYKNLQKKLKDKTIEDLYNLPEMQNQEMKVVMEILMSTAFPAYLKLPSIGTILNLIMVDITLTYGNSHIAAIGYCYYSGFLCTINNFQNAIQFGELGERISKKFPHYSTILKIPQLLGAFTQNWVAHSKKSVDLLLESFQKYSSIKDINHSSSVIGNSFQISYILGRDLKTLSTFFKPYTLFLYKNQSKDTYYGCNYLYSFIQILEGTESVFQDFEGRSISEEEYIELLKNSELKTGLYYYYISKMHLEYLFLKYEEAYKFHLLGKTLRIYGAGLLNSAQDIFISSLVLIRVLKNSPEESGEQELEGYIKQLKIWAENNPFNFKHKYYLVLAEFQRWKKEFWEAGKSFEIAIESAIENEYNMDAGLCAELCAEFYLEQERISFSKKYFEISTYHYSLSGANAKVAQIHSLHPGLLPDELRTLKSASSIQESIHTSTLGNSSIDLSSVLQANSALSEEHKMESLLSKLMKILLENAGATRGLLLLMEKDTLIVEVEGISENNQITFLNTPAIEYSELPFSILQYALRTLESIILDSALLDERFSENPYIIREKILSLLCIPILSKGICIGILYLENNLMKGAFTKNRIEVLNMITSQAAISIESARLYDSLERKVLERTMELETQKRELESTLTELRSTQAQLVEAEKSAALGQLISGIAHEINNPLAAIRSGAEIIEMDQDNILQKVPLFFQNSSPELISEFQSLFHDSVAKRIHLNSREERQRKKKIYKDFESFSFSSTEKKETILDYFIELFLEDSYPGLKDRFSEDEILNILKYISLFSTQKLALKNIKLSTEKSARIIFSLRKYLKTSIRGTERQASITDLIESSLKVYSNYIHGIITIEKNYSLTPTITCVIDEIQQVLKNIIFNAVQAMYTVPEKVLKINIDLHRESEKELIRIVFEDMGTGISKDVVHKLFTPFFTTKPSGEGIGLGLFVSRTIMEEHQGMLRYEPTEKGSRFTVIFKGS